MVRVARSGVLWLTMLVMLAFAPFALFVPQEHLFAVLNSIAFSVSLAVVIAYGYGFYLSLTTDRRVGGHLLILGLSFGWLSSSARHLYMWIWRYNGEPIEWINDPWLGIIPWIAIYGACLHLAARNAPVNNVPSRNLVIIGISIAFGLIVALLVIGLRVGSPRFS
jgi:hypothetical protein